MPSPPRCENRFTGTDRKYWMGIMRRYYGDPSLAAKALKCKSGTITYHWKKWGCPWRKYYEKRHGRPCNASQRVRIESIRQDPAALEAAIIEADGDLYALAPKLKITYNALRHLANALCPDWQNLKVKKRHRWNGTKWGLCGQRKLKALGLIPDDRVSLEVLAEEEFKRAEEVMPMT